MERSNSRSSALVLLESMWKERHDRRKNIESLDTWRFGRSAHTACGLIGVKYCNSQYCRILRLFGGGCPVQGHDGQDDEMWQEVNGGGDGGRLGNPSTSSCPSKGAGGRRRRRPDAVYKRLARPGGWQPRPIWYHVPFHELNELGDCWRFGRNFRLDGA